MIKKLRFLERILGPLVLHQGARKFEQVFAILQLANHLMRDNFQRLDLPGIQRLRRAPHDAERA